MRELKLSLLFGALCPPLHKQLGVDPADVRVWQKDADAITRLSVRGLIPPRVAEQARKRVLRQIAESHVAGGPTR